jgi:putative transcriptional regulator
MLKARGKTRYWLAKQTGITYPAIDNLCKGKTQRIDFATLGALCDALDCQPSDLLVNIPDKGSKDKSD